MRKSPFIVGGIAIALLSGLVVWLQAAPVVGGTSVNPAYVVINTPTAVTITSTIPDSSLLPGGVNLLRTDASGKTISTIGVMHDDGLYGDAKAGDKAFSYQLTINQPSVGQVYYRASAAFKGVLQRVLSNVVAVTVDPFKLPPDPGEAGKETLEGIDSDLDGVRDDMQRWIAVREPDRTDKRDSLSRFTRSMQSFLTQATNEADALAINETKEKERACWRYLAPADDQLALGELRLVLLNTQARLKVYLNNDKLLGGHSFLLKTPSSSACQP